jgi:hypothetical protein
VVAEVDGMVDVMGDEMVGEVLAETGTREEMPTWHKSRQRF